MSEWVRERIEESTFLELAACAFFCGAEAQFRKLSQLDYQTGRDYLIDVLMDIGNIGESKAEALMNTIHRLAKRYYLIENIVEQGKTAADQWLNCHDGEPPLQTLVSKYQNLSMFDLGIEGINEEHEQLQQELYATVNESVGELRRRSLIVLLVITSLVASISAALLYL